MLNSRFDSRLDSRFQDGCFLLLRFDSVDLGWGFELGFELPLV